MRLGINIDHLATLRQARLTPYPNLSQFVQLAHEEGVQQITLHLREDRRHIQDHDIHHLRPLLRSLGMEMNFEMAPTEEMVALACAIEPEWVCLVPEKREELTTEGGLDVVRLTASLDKLIPRLRAKGIAVSLFIQADSASTQAAATLGAQAVEYHTGGYADAWLLQTQRQDGKPDESWVKHAIAPFVANAQLAGCLGLFVHAGHGLTRDNVFPIANIPEVRELNIGHALVCDAVLMGWSNAIRAMQKAIGTR